MKVLSSNLLVAEYVQTIGDRRTAHTLVGAILSNAVPITPAGLWLYCRATLSEVADARTVSFQVRVRRGENAPVVIVHGELQMENTQQENPSAELALPLPPFIINDFGLFTLELTIGDQPAGVAHLEARSL